MQRRVFWTLAVLACAALFGRAGTARADTPAPYPNGVTPVYLIISLDTTSFDATSVPTGEQLPSQVGSHTILLNIGTFIANGGILDTRYVSAQLAKFPSTSPSALLGHQATVLGSFQTSDVLTIHMVTSAPGAIAPDIQVAVYESTRLRDLDALVSTPTGGSYPTTYQIANTIWERIPPGSSTTVQNVSSAIFGGAGELTGGGGVVAVQSEGELFPHDPTAPALFHFTFSVEGDGDLTSDVCLSVPIDVKPDSSTNPVERKSNGKVPVAILSTEHFDATEYANADIQIAGVSPSHVAVEDVNGDGLDDLICQFPTEDLVDAGALDLTDTTLVVEATLPDGACIRGFDVITVKK